MTSLPSQSERVVKAVLGTKLGMTQVWDETGRLVPVTVVQVGTNVVTQVRTVETDGYSAVQLGFGQIDPRRTSQPLRGHYEKAGVTPRRHVAEVRTAVAAEYNLGQELTAETFEVGATVDVVGTSKGKGTAGVMKRHGFAGVAASHGAHRNHRKPGSSVAPPPRAACSVASGWPAGWATRARPSRTSRSTRWTRRRACCSSPAPSPGPRVASSWSRLL